MLLFARLKLLNFKNSSVILNAVKNRGVPAKDSGDTGPTVIKEYCLDATSNVLWGSRND